MLKIQKHSVQNRRLADYCYSGWIFIEKRQVRIMNLVLVDRRGAVIRKAF